MQSFQDQMAQQMGVAVQRQKTSGMQAEMREEMALAVATQQSRLKNKLPYDYDNTYMRE
jgi:hypothetical protein